MKTFGKAITVLFFALALLSIVGCGSSTDSDSFSLMNPGVYTTKGTGYSGTEFTVQVTVGPASITDITITGLADTSYLGNVAGPMLIDRMMEFQTAGVDTIAGATITSEGIKAAVVEALRKAGAPAVFTNTMHNQKIDVTEIVDVLVIGGGAAGFSAAVRAKEVNDTVSPSNQRGPVVLIEKLDMFGGSTKTSAGIIYAPLGSTSAPNTSDQALMKAYYLMRAQGYADENLLQTFVDNAYGTLDFLGITAAGSAMGTATEARGRFVSYVNGGIVLMETLEGKAETAGVDYRTGIRATRLVKNEAGRVVQVKAESRNVNYTFNVRRGVIIAAGGFDSDHTGLMAQYNYNSRNDIPASSHSNIGDGIKMGIEIGAATVFKGGKIGWAIIDRSSPGSSVMSGWRTNAPAGSILIKQDGELVPIAPAAGGAVVDGVTLTTPTYANNNPDYPPLHSALLRARDAGATKFWIISNATNAPSATNLARGFAYTSTVSVEDLASQIGADPVKLAASFDARFTTPTRWTVTKVEPSSIGSMGGLKINVTGQVLKVSGDGDSDDPNFAGFAVIPGLWAAGESANGDFYYQEYPASGSSLSLAITFGRLAGTQAGDFTRITTFPVTP